MEPLLLDKFASSSIISEIDSYLNNFSKFDLQSRMGSVEEVTQKVFLEFLSQQTLDWELTEKNVIKKIVSELNQAYNSFKHLLPKYLSFIKTTGREECDAAYTRKNKICIPISMVRWPYNELKELIAHELFHVISNSNQKIRNNWYNKLGFISCPELQIPNEYSELYVSNPDTIGKNCYIQIVKNGKSEKAVSFLYSETPYRGGYFFQYFRFSFLIAEVYDGKCIPLYEHKQLKFIDVPQSLYELCFEIDPYNNQHRLHPEEMLAYYWSFIPFSELELDPEKKSFFQKIHRIMTKKERIKI
ncbi:MAG: hypothetical protein ACFFE4_16520 [Candidatus Thorarchaeota archaeon]